MLPPPFGPLSGRVLGNPSIFNVFWDDNWNSDHSGAFSTDSIDNMTKALVSSKYFDAAGQYGVGSASFDDSNTSGGLLNPCPSTPGSTTDFVSILGFIECEVSLLPTGVPSPDDNSLYVVYLPRGTTIDNFGINKSCDSFGAYHFMGNSGDAPRRTRKFAFAVVPLDCAHGSADELSTLVSHEVIEAATDPNVVLGWIDNSKFDITNLHTALHRGRGGGHLRAGRRRRADRPPVRLDGGTSGRHVLVERRQRLCADSDRRPGAHEDGQPRSGQRGRPALLHLDRSPNNGPNDVPDASVTDTLPAGGHVRDRRPRNLHRGAGRAR